MIREFHFTAVEVGVALFERIRSQLPPGMPVEMPCRLSTRTNRSELVSISLAIADDPSELAGTDLGVQP